MAKAFGPPSTALVELQGLKTEVYSLRREKANAELREAEARRELADLTSKAQHIAAPCMVPDNSQMRLQASWLLGMCQHLQYCNASYKPVDLCAQFLAQLYIKIDVHLLCSTLLIVRARECLHACLRLD